MSRSSARDTPPHWGGEGETGCWPALHLPPPTSIPRDRTSTTRAYREASAALTLPAPSALLHAFGTSDWRRLGAAGPNDFERVAFNRHPVLAKVRDVLAVAGAAVARLTGSGSAVFGIFTDEDDARAAARRTRQHIGIQAALVVPTLATMPRPRLGTDADNTMRSP